MLSKNRSASPEESLMGRLEGRSEHHWPSFETRRCAAWLTPDAVDFCRPGAFHLRTMSTARLFDIVIRITDPAPRG